MHLMMILCLSIFVGQAQGTRETALQYRQSARKTLALSLSPTPSSSRKSRQATTLSSNNTNNNHTTANTTTWQWPLQDFRIVFAQQPEDDLILAGRFADYLTQPLQFIYSESVLLYVFVTLTTTQIDWTVPYFLYDFVGQAVMALPPNHPEDIPELQRLQWKALNHTAALHAFWNERPVPFFLPPPPPSASERSHMYNDKWIWIVIAIVVTVGGILCTTFFVWRVWNRRRQNQQQAYSSTNKQQQQHVVVQEDSTPPDEAVSVAWSTPLGKEIPATFYGQDDESLTHHPADNSMSAGSPMRAPMHQFDTDSIVQGYSDPESPPRTARKRQLPAFPLHSESTQPAIMTPKAVDMPLDQPQTASDRPDTKRALFSQPQPDNPSLPSDEERQENASLSPENDVLGYYLRRKRGSK